MFIPIRTDYQRRHRPWVNYGLVLTNVIAFVWLYIFSAGSDDLKYHNLVTDLMLSPVTPAVSQFFTSMFLHGGWAHLLGNMVFLWVFGNAINDKFGHLGYLAFYLGGGIIAAVGYLWLGGDSYVLGASGAIAAVTGAYLILLPRTHVTVLIIIHFIWPMELSSLIFIAFQVAFNFYMTIINHADGVAYSAHSSGYVFGIVVPFVMLKFGMLARDDWDMLHLYRQFRRRGEYKRMAEGSYDVFSPNHDVQRARHLAKKVFEVHQPEDPRQLELRQEIYEACNDYDMPAAAKIYKELLTVADEPVLAQQMQLDIANQLMAQKDYADAARAYEIFVKFYANSPYVEDVYLMLGRIYSRYEINPDRAAYCLLFAIDRLRDLRNKQMAKSELESLQKRYDVNLPGDENA